MSDPTRQPYRALAPGSQRILSVDWVDLLPAGVTVSSVAVTTSAPLSVVGVPSVSSQRIGNAMIAVSGAATVGTQVNVVFTATWSDSQVDVRTIQVTITAL